MRKYFLCLMASTLLFSGAEAGLFGDDVDFADLSQLSSEALETLKDAEYKVFYSKVKHAEMKVLEKREREDLKSVKSVLDAKRLRFKAAKTELKDIRERSAGKKLADAEAVLRNAQKAVDIAKLHVNWKEKELDMRIAGAEKEKAAIAVAEAERDLARVLKLHAQKAPSAGKYRVDDFKEGLGKRQKELEIAISKEKSEIFEAKKRKLDYEKLYQRQE